VNVSTNLGAVYRQLRQKLRVLQAFLDLWRAAAGPLLHFAAMFIHRTVIAGRSDRGAWPWRKPASLAS
ncbi:MAG: hypothetical protein KA145_03305, partial [Alicycliphilus sp.]|nr:hypothetical protein [Alicycliphilus sp.]